MGMTATERKELRKLIDDEFASAKSHVFDLAAMANDQAQEEVEAKFATQRKTLNTLLDKIEKIQKKADDDIANIKREIRKAGFKEGYRSWEVAGEQVELDKARRKISEDQAAAIRELDRRRRDVEKDLILGSLETEDARKFVDSIPDVSAILSAGPLKKALTAGG